MAGTEASDASEGGGSFAAPSPAAEAAVVIAVRALEMEAAAGGCKVLLDEQQKKPVGKAAAAAGAAVVVDVDGSGGWDGEKVCRICHLSPDRRGGGPELIQLGCGCKDELGTAHRECAETWFKLRGNRCCEICGTSAKNIVGQGDGSFMEEWHEGRVLNDGSTNPTERGGCWRGQPFCNFLLGCLVVAFILPWFLRVNMF